VILISFMANFLQLAYLVIAALLILVSVRIVRRRTIDFAVAYRIGIYAIVPGTILWTLCAAFNYPLVIPFGSTALLLLVAVGNVREKRIISNESQAVSHDMIYFVSKKVAMVIVILCTLFCIFPSPFSSGRIPLPAFTKFVLFSEARRPDMPPRVCPAIVGANIWLGWPFVTLSDVKDGCQIRIETAIYPLGIILNILTIYLAAKVTGFVWQLRKKLQ